MNSPNLAKANIYRAQKAAFVQVGQVRDAVRTLDLDAPAHLIVAAMARLNEPQASMAELGQRLRISKDAVRARLRQLLILADRKRSTPTNHSQ